MEELLIQEEIDLIEVEALKVKYQDPFILHLGAIKTSIFKVSSRTGLILIHGNKWTGREHIDLRHSQTSRTPYWQENDKMDNPSKFHLSLAPIDYLSLADQVFSYENLNSTKNKRAKEFDMFISKASSKNIPTTEYTLLLYKGTKIIHSFYVSANKKPFNKKKIVNLRQGWISSTFSPMIGIESFTIPYFDQNNTERYKVILRSNKIDKTDSWYIQQNDNQGNPKLTLKIKTEQLKTLTEGPFRMTELDFSNLSWIEKHLKKLYEEENKST